MSSLRPLATIALLAAVGVFLYVKINQTEPKLPPDLQEWSTSAVDVGGFESPAASADVASAGAGMSTPNAASGGGVAPSFSSVSAQPAQSSGASNSQAPPWTPAPLDVEESASSKAPDSSIEDTSPVARAAVNDAEPVLPSVPPMPASPSGAPDSPIAAMGSTAAMGSVAGLPYGNSTSQPETQNTAPQPSMFAAARVAVQGALDRGELAQALLLLSDWYGDPSLTPEETAEVNQLLGQLAGSVIYEGPPAHRLLPAHHVQVGETLEAIANKYEVPWQLLAKINGIAHPHALAVGQELKVVQGPFSAVIDLSQRMMTVMLDRRYAGRFAVEFDPAATIEEGQWKVDQKLVTPASAAMTALPNAASEDRSILLVNLANPGGSATVLRGPGSALPATPESRRRSMRLKETDVNDVFDILSVGSRVTIRQ